MIGLTLVLTLAALAPPDDLTARLDDVLFRLADARGAHTWDLAQELRDAARSDSIQAVPHLSSAADGASDTVRLVIGRTLLDLDAADEAADLLLGLLDTEHADESLAVLSDKAFRRTRHVASELESRLSQPRSAGLRIAIARSLYKVSREPRTRTLARKVLLETLDSDDPDVRADGALALAEIADFDSARPVLSKLTADPGPRGQLARAYLETDEKINYYTKKLYRQSEQVPLGNDRPRYDSETFASGPGSLDVLEELIGRIQDFHLLGEELRGAEGRERLITAAAKGMLNALDPHSTYFSSKEFERWILDLQRHYAGIGAYVNTVNNVFTITTPIYSGPAYRAGLLSGDQILKVDGWDTMSQPDEDIIRRLKGEPNTEVTITVYRDGWQKTRDFVITREVINIPSVRDALLPGAIGYIEVLGFAEGTWREVRDAISSLEDRGMEGLIVDVRNNSGGYLDEAVRICSLFLDPGSLVVYTEGRGVARQDFKTQRVRGMDGPYDGPVVMLMNTRSASASEIVAGALQEYGRARLIGEKSFGKGSVQQAMPLETRPGDKLLTDNDGDRAYDPGEDYDDLDGDGKYSYPVNVKITNARYFLPSGHSLHTERDIEGRIQKYGGIEPDVVVEFDGLAGWENHELALLQDRFKDEQPFREYAKGHFGEFRELFYELADGDDHEPARYPDFQAFRDTLETPLSDDTIRLMIRLAVRDLIADDRGKAFPGYGIHGDWQEDSQLQMGIALLAQEMSMDLTAYEAYDDFADIVPN